MITRETVKLSRTETRHARRMTPRTANGD